MKRELIEFLYESTRAYDINITEDTEIENELGVTGDDAEELIKKFSDRFNVDITVFKFEKYFLPEYWPDYKKLPEIKILRVSHLLKAIEAGRLNDQVIDGSY